MFKLNRTAFTKGKPENMPNNVDYWKTKSAGERLAAAWYLTCSAYNIDPKTKLDKNSFSCYKQTP